MKPLQIYLESFCESKKEFFEHNKIACGEICDFFIEEAEKVTKVKVYKRRKGKIYLIEKKELQEYKNHQQKEQTWNTKQFYLKSLWKFILKFPRKPRKEK